MSTITTHVLDTSVGRPAAGMEVHLDRRAGDEWERVGRAETDADGRARSLVRDGQSVPAGVYRLTFDTGAYFARSASPTFYPTVMILFEIDDGQHYHVPLLVSPFGYSTYRGS